MTTIAQLKAFLSQFPDDLEVRVVTTEENYGSYYSDTSKYREVFIPEEVTGNDLSYKEYQTFELDTTFKYLNGEWSSKINCLLLGKIGE